MPPHDNVPWLTSFRVEEKYSYLEGLGNYHSSEAFPGALPKVINSPQKPPFGLKTERISGSSFCTPRHLTAHTWLYRSSATLFRSESTLVEEPQKVAHYLRPDSLLWPTFPAVIGDSFISQKLLASNGDPIKKSGCSVWLFGTTNDMPERTAFCSLDGESLIIPQAGTLDIQTELGKLLVRQNEIAVLPRGIRYRVDLPEGHARGYIVELYQGHFRLPDLGPIGTTGLANSRDFKIPTAFYSGHLDSSTNTLQPPSSLPWKIYSRLTSHLYTQTQPTTPFDVASWHGTHYPYKYDLSSFNSLANALYDEHDPSLYTVLSAPSSTPGTSVIDFAIIPPRWQVAEKTLWIPYYHRNTMTELAFPIVREQGGGHAFNREREGFVPFGAVMHSGMSPHGASGEELERAEGVDTTRPVKVGDEAVMVGLVETEMPLVPSLWALEIIGKGKGRERGKL